MNNAKIGTALIGGYLLGRRKNTKAALGLALAMAVRRAKAGDIAEALAPVLGNLNRQARTELAGATKAAVGSVLNAQADHLADALHRRTVGLQEQREDLGPQGQREDEDREAEEEPRDEEEKEERPRAKKAERRPSSQPKSGGGARRASSSGSSSTSRARESDDD
ncbi:hypothetical protein I2W78_26435 [Streptomyces spinoverrucosus]|uniref:hypothetical protein n=1 Tax=Streptomyces spinoverrucosus TaxID=284043 RepID=UPI0018C3CC4C|nr:hypothetical protein [Streptomyces spinoverrucosus]MBG0855290.1 hypothetical protein [Streptomyces spinoverrucosus]